jgi:hypothetical protein
MKVKEENGRRKKNIKIHFEFFILISPSRKDADRKAGFFGFVVGRVCSCILANPQRGERLLDVPKRKDMKEKVGKNHIWSTKYAFNNRNTIL